MLDEQGIERDPVALGHNLAEPRFRLFRRARPHHAEPVGDAVDVRVDRYRRDPVPEHEDAIRRLGPDVREREELVERARDLAAVAVEQRLRGRPDAPRLDPVETRRADQGLDLRDRRGRETTGVGVAREEPGARDVGVLVARPLREDRADEHLEGVLGVVAQVGPSPVAPAVERREPVENRDPIHAEPPVSLSGPAGARAGPRAQGRRGPARRPRGAPSASARRRGNRCRRPA